MDDSKISLTVAPAPHGKHTVEVAIDGKVEFLHRLDLANAEDRARAEASICAALPGLDPEELAQRLRDVVSRCESDRTTRGKTAPGRQPAPANVEASTPEELAEAGEILRSADLVAQIESDLGTMGIAGEDGLRTALYLVGTSRLLTKPMHAIVQGDSSSGKTFIVETVASLLPPESVLSATHLSPMALFRMDDRLRHKFLVLGERSRADGPEYQNATKGLRQLQSSGRLTSETVVDGKQKSFSAEGPVASVETTTKEEIFDEDANRCLLLPTDSSPAQIGRVILAQADERTRDGERLLIRRRHHAMQRLLEAEGPATVTIPFGRPLAESFPRKRPHEARAHSLLRSAITASALLHRFQREIDDRGSIVAEPADYAVALRVVGSVIESAVTGEACQKDIDFWTELRQHFSLGDIFTSTEVAVLVKRDKNRINESFKRLERLGVIGIEEAARGPTPAKWTVLRDVLAKGASFLPPPDRLRTMMASHSSPRAETGAEDLDDEAVDEVLSFAGVLDGDIGAGHDGQDWHDLDGIPI